MTSLFLEPQQNKLFARWGPKFVDENVSFMPFRVSGG
jgi:hypothetical protein